MVIGFRRILLIVVMLVAISFPGIASQPVTDNSGSLSGSLSVNDYLSMQHPASNNNLTSVAAEPKEDNTSLFNLWGIHVTFNKLVPLALLAGVYYILMKRRARSRRAEL